MMKLKKVNLKVLNSDATLVKVAGGCPHTVHDCGVDRTIPVLNEIH
ncbi:MULTISPECIES: hypothetical protein [Pseudoalteromonas]|nr:MULTISPECIES: hypothetical protein [Pseudoalteromonas]